MNAPDNLSGIEDYKWVKFAVNSDYGVANDKYVKYPGDQNYDDLKINDGTDNLPPGSSYVYTGNYQEARLLDVKQFVKRINGMKKEFFFLILKCLKSQAYCDTIILDPSMAFCPLSV